MPATTVGANDYHGCMPVDIGLVLIVILVLVLIWRGPSTLPKLGQAFGRGVREARDAAAGPADPARSTTEGEPTTAGREDSTPPR